MELSKIMVAIIRSALTGKQLDQQTAEEMQLYNPTSNTGLYNLAASHSVANIVSIGLLQNGFDVENTFFENAELEAAVSDAEIEAAISSIRALFEKHRITFILLKGLVLKEFYPESSMRTCGDIDILVCEEDINVASDCLVKELGYKGESYNFHDVLLTAEGYPTIELHFSVLYDIEKLDGILSTVWEYSETIDGKYERKLTDDFFLFFILAHIYHHFITGGCGVRFFMDLWVIRHKMSIQYTDEVKSLCREAGIEKFAESSLVLSEVWFGEGAEHTKLTLAMQEYILSGGTFGNKENAAARVSITEKKKGRIRYNLSRLLLPYDKAKLLYPDMKSWQFPIYEVKRWGELLRKGTAHRAMIAQESKELSEEKRESIRKLFCELEID